MGDVSEVHSPSVAFLRTNFSVPTDPNDLPFSRGKRGDKCVGREHAKGVRGISTLTSSTHSPR